MAGDDELNSFLELGANDRRFGLAVEFAKRNGGHAVAVHILAAGMLSINAARADLVEQIIHPLGDVLAVRAFAGKVAGGLEGDEDITGDRHGMTCFLATATPRAIRLLLTGHILERALDDFFRGGRHLHIVARARLHFVSRGQPAGGED